MYHAVSEHMMRPISRDCDEHEHTKPTQFYDSMWSASAAADIQVGNDKSKKPDAAGAPPRRANLLTVLSTEELCWGDAGLYLSTPNSGLGGAAVMAAGTPEQKERFLKRFKEGKPKWGAMAITEPSFGSDSSQVTTTADARRRPLGDQRHQDFLHRGRDGGREVRRLRRRVGDGRQERGTPRHQAVRRRAQHARHDGGAESRTSSASARPIPPRSSSTTAGFRSTLCWAAPRFARKAASRT